jgi:acetyl esterase
MAAVVSMLAVDCGLPPLRAQALFYPATDADHPYPSMRQYASGYYLTADALRWSAQAHIPSTVSSSDFTVSPIRAPAARLAVSPPTLVVTAEFDPLRDEGEAFARRLIDAGVPVVATRYLGTIHAFLTLRALARTAAPRVAISQAAAALVPALHT